jgi:diaminohydroxyphosphoribosylaminopyrimidine deaminase/5-amino-6-(5-phosphoribosylamino)uracil reductase
MAVTLEPCCHTGRTGPCTGAIIEAKLAQVSIGCRDPHELVARRSVPRLRAAGVDVRLGVLERECQIQNRGFLSVCARGRPFVTLKLAATVDGRIATAGGESRWITGPAARSFAHGLRSSTDAIMVGGVTARTDDPELTARRGGRVVHRPVRVLVDSKLRTSPKLRLFGDADSQTWVLHKRGARGRRALEARGARLLEVKSRGDHLDLRAALECLADQGLTTVLVEGGGQLAAALLRRGLVDELHWLQAPRLLGGDARPALGALGVKRLRDAQELGTLRIRRLGDDLHIHAQLYQPED